MQDGEGLLALQRVAEMMRYFADGHTYTEDESRVWLEWHVSMWDLAGYGFWAVERKPAREFIGWLGVEKVWDAPESLTELMPASEVGWFIDHRYWGQGLATEGARRALQFAFGPLHLPRVIARYHAANVASGRVMEKIGMQFCQEFAHPEVPDVVVRVYQQTAG